MIAFAFVVVLAHVFNYQIAILSRSRERRTTKKDFVKAINQPEIVRVLATGAEVGVMSNTRSRAA